MTLAEPARRIVNNVFMTAIARVLMAATLPVILAFVTVGGWWLQSERADMQHQVAAVTATANSTAGKLDNVSERLTTVEARQQRDVASSQRFQKEMLERQDRMQAAIVQLSNSVSALTATVKALADQNRDPP